MLVKITDTYASSLLASIPGIFHCFTSRPLGDMRNENAKANFLVRYGDAYAAQVHQVHGTTICHIDEQKQIERIDADGMVLTSRSQIKAIAIHVADCVPLLFVDPATNIIAATHAGWRGTAQNIARRTVEAMEKSGAKRENILVSLGPSIGPCCYSVSEERVSNFLAYVTRDHVVQKKEDHWYLNLAGINFYQLQDAGIIPIHIDASPPCTSCHIDEFYSYRKDTKETFGEIMGVIGFQTV